MISSPAVVQVKRRRSLLTVLTLTTTCGGTWTFASSAAADGWSLLDGLSLALFTVLFTWVALSFWMATIGFALLLRRPREEHANDESTGTVRPLDGASLSPTAIVMPIYNEDPASVFSGIQAIYESLEATDRGATFDFYILSDTTDGEKWLAEELAWSQLQERVGGVSRVFYRHRQKNTSRKAGNIADFCKRWGSLYRYMVILDADSLMTGSSIVELVRRMDADPQIGILQAPPQPVGRHSFFARTQQFAAALYAPIFLEGFAWWTEDDGNYWGHNAIIRTDAFLRHCGLAPLPGKAPLGGEILSHDFVEAALMRRAGYKVRLAQDLDGSYEQCPPTLLAFAQRDQRWCQGNLQHMRLVIADGLRSVSRFHFACGVMSYCSSPLWLMFLVVSLTSAALGSSHADGGRGVPWIGATGLFVLTMMLLLLPKIWSYGLLLCSPARTAQFGGAGKAAAGLLTETLLSIVIAPIMMAFHTTFVVLTFLGKKVHWNAQQRNEAGIPWGDALAAHWRQMAVGVAAALLIGLAIPSLLPWLSPVLIGLILAAPISVMSSSVTLGSWLERRNVLATPDERIPPQVVTRQQELAEVVEAEAATGTLFQQVLIDPVLLALHRSILEATDAHSSAAQATIDRVDEQLRKGRAAQISAEDRKAVLSDPIALGKLHRIAWSAGRSS